MREEHLHPYLQLRANFLDVRRVWGVVTQRRDLPTHSANFLKKYHSDINSVLDYYLKDSVFLIKNIDGFQDGETENKEQALFDLLENFSFSSPSSGHLPPSENEKMLTDLSKLTLDRLYRISRRFLQLENESYAEENFLFHDEDLLSSWILGLFIHASEYLQKTSSLMQIEEGRLEVERILQAMDYLLPQLSALTGRDIEINTNREQVVRDYFESYAFCMQLQHDLDWEFLAGLCRRLQLVLQKATNEFNRVSVSREIRHLSVSFGDLLRRIPKGSSQHRRFNIERRCYNRMVNGLFTLCQKTENKPLEALQ